MDINTIQGMNTYAAFNTTKADERLVQTNQDAATTNTGIESIQTVQEAFQVDITQEALAMQAENTGNLPAEEAAAQVETNQIETNQAETDRTETSGTQTKQPPQASFSQGQTQQVSQLVDILV